MTKGPLLDDARLLSPPETVEHIAICGKRVADSVRPYPKVDIKMTTLADLEGNMKVVALVEGLKEAALVLSRHDHVVSRNGLEGNQYGSREEDELVHRCSAETCRLLKCKGARMSEEKDGRG